MRRQARCVVAPHENRTDDPHPALPAAIAHRIEDKAERHTTNTLINNLTSPPKMTTASGVRALAPATVRCEGSPTKTTTIKHNKGMPTNHNTPEID